MITEPPPCPPYRFPAEWSPHEATWLGWPHNRSDWPGKMSVIPWVYAEMIRNIATGEKLRILVNDEKHEQRARSILTQAGTDLSQVQFYHWPTHRGWTRDFGPLFVSTPESGRAIIDFQFNAWARYPHWQKDTAISGRAAQELQLPRVPAVHGDRSVVLEGGAIEVNGCGTLLTTEECLLDPTVQCRNPGFSKTEYEAVFRRYLGITNTIWLGRGVLGDDTHGHIDDLCRFVNPTTAVIARETNPHDANYAALEENHERLEGARLEDGRAITVIDLPMPAPLYHAGRRLPASYANFYICNAAVLVPTFNDPRDRTALGILADCFPDRPAIGIHAVDLVLGLGTIHCLTQQEPETSRIEEGHENAGQGKRI